MDENAVNAKTWKPTWKDIALMGLLGILFVGLIVVCVLYYNWSNVDSILYLGWSIFFISLVLMSIMRREFIKKGESKGGRWLNTTKVVDTGIYSIIRHPQYLSFILVIIALILISHHWLSPILGIPIICYLYWCMKWEEQGNIEKFGEEYRKYMERVPRANFIVGMIRLARC